MSEAEQKLFGWEIKTELICKFCGHDAGYHQYPDTCQACPEGICPPEDADR